MYDQIIRGMARRPKECFQRILEILILIIHFQKELHQFNIRLYEISSVVQVLEDQLNNNQYDLRGLNPWYKYDLYHGLNTTNAQITTVLRDGEQLIWWSPHDRTFRELKDATGALLLDLPLWRI